MSIFTQVGFDNYTLSGDVAVIAICCTIAILLKTAYVSRTRSLRIFMNIVVSLMLAAVVNIAYHLCLLKIDSGLLNLVYVFRVLYQAMIFDVFFLFALYITEISGLEHRKARIVAICSVLLLVCIIGIDVTRTLLGIGFRITADGAVLHRTNIFVIGYLLYVIELVVLMSYTRDFLYKRVMFGFYGTMALSLIIRFAQLVTNQSSLTTMTFVFPVIAMLYIMHCNPYNVSLGSVDIHAMQDMVHQMYEKRMPFIFISLLLPEYNEEGRKLPAGIQAQVRKFAADYFRRGVLFQIGNGHMILIVPKHRNADYEKKLETFLKNFDEQCQRFQTTFKIVIGESIKEISKKNEYASFIQSIEREKKDNTINRVTQDDINRFNRSKYYLSELADIHRKQDLNDERVLVFCQPVFNLKTGQFDSAEALMRLNLQKTGLILPDDFIPIAEEQGFIHVLTKIILNKTCHAIHEMTEEGYLINRISVNLSALELKDEEICNEIHAIIDSNGIKTEKIALEITESRNDADFLVMKEKIEQLRKQGIQFYLDDFGTGYSNMERIMELPFDIIKFDRSLVIMSRDNKRSEKFIDNLANMFNQMNYSVLYEGVENEMDAARCKEMFASYLQGYKYSQPIPIEQLKCYLEKAG